MINKKAYELGSRPSKIREIAERCALLKEKLGEDKVFDFSIGNPSVYPPKELNAEIKNAITNIDPVILHSYTSAQGLAETRKAIVDYLNKTYNVNESEDFIMLTHGASGALAATFEALASKKDEYLVFAPYFPEYRVFAEKTGVKLVEVLPNENFLPDFLDFKKKINKNTKAVIFNSPNNPTGVVYDEHTISEIAHILHKAEQKFKHPIYLISDEPYRELVYKDMDYPFLTKYYDNSIVIYSFSKVLSIPGERFGYVLLSNRMESKDEVFNAILGSARSEGYICSSTMLQKIIPNLLGKTADIKQYAINKKLFEGMFDELGYEYVKGDGAFYILLKSLEPDASHFCDVAQKYNIFVVPSDDFGVNGYVRVSYCVKEDTIKNSYEAFKSLNEYYEALK